MSTHTINIFNKNLESLLNNISENFKDIGTIIKINYTMPLESEIYIENFVNSNINNIDKGNDISNKNEIIFSKGLTIIHFLDFNYIWNHPDMTLENKNMIWKYIQSLYLYSLEYSKNVDFKQILKDYNQTNEIKDDISRQVINIFNNLSNKVETTELVLEETESESDSAFKMPDLSSLIGKHLMNLINNIVNNIHIESVNLDNPLELIKLLLSGSFSLKDDTSGIGLLVKDIIEKLKTELLSSECDRKELFKDIERVLSLVNNFTNSNYDIRNVIPDFDNKEFNDNFDNIINSIDFETILNTMLVKIKDVQENSNIDIGNVITEIFKDVSTNNMDISSILKIAMKLSNIFKQSTESQTSDHTDSNETSTSNDSSENLDLGGILSSIMGNTGNTGNTSDNDNNNLDLGGILSGIMGTMGNSDNNLDLNGMLSSMMSTMGNTTNNDTSDNNLDLNSMLSSMMGSLHSDNCNTEDNTEDNIEDNIDINSIMQSITKNLPSELTKNLPKDMSSILNNSNLDINSISDLLNSNNLDELKKMIPSSKKSRINTSKLNQFSRLEKRRARLREKLEKRKQVLNLK